jgi:hypothetical protein
MQSILSMQIAFGESCLIQPQTRHIGNGWELGACAAEPKRLVSGTLSRAKGCQLKDANSKFDNQYDVIQLPPAP